MVTFWMRWFKKWKWFRDLLIFQDFRGFQSKKRRCHMKSSTSLFLINLNFVFSDPMKSNTILITLSGYFFNVVCSICSYHCSTEKLHILGIPTVIINILGNYQSLNKSDEVLTYLCYYRSKLGFLMFFSLSIFWK